MSQMHNHDICSEMHGTRRYIHHVAVVGSIQTSRKFQHEVYHND